MYQDRRNIPSAVINPAPPDPYTEPKMLGFCAFQGALAAGIFTIPVAFLVRAPGVAISIIAGIWGFLLLFQLAGWHNYFARVRPAQKRAAVAKAAAEAASARLVDIKARNAAANKVRQAALADYKQALEEGQAALRELSSEATSLSDKKRAVRAHLDLLEAQSSNADEPDLATRLTLQTKAMRRETQHIRNIHFTF